MNTEIYAEGRFIIDKKIPGLSLLDEYVVNSSLIKPRILIKLAPFGFN